jgi:phosphoglucomutase
LPYWLKKQFDLLVSQNKEKVNLLFGKSNFKFGTSGIRLEMGLGNNKFNEITIKKITLGFLEFLKNHYSDLLHKGLIVIGDNRKYSRTFVKLICTLCAQEKINVFHYHSYFGAPTPFLNYLVKHRGAVAGIAITASHNPAIYNGFKVYNFQSQQFMEKETEIISKNIEKIKFDFNLDFSTVDKSYIHSINYS